MSNIRPVKRMTINATTTERCGVCRYAREWQETIGQCRRSAAPAVTVDQEHDDFDESVHVAVWPLVSDDDWCGEFMGVMQ